jgi:hypothetical protein
VAMVLGLTSRALHRNVVRRRADLVLADGLEYSERRMTAGMNASTVAFH